MNPKKETLPPGVERAVIAACEDYGRRAKEIERGTLPPELIGNYMMLNAAVDNAIASCCEESIRTEMREDIGLRKGIRQTRLYYLSPSTYKLRKRESELAIAKALKLL